MRRHEDLSSPRRRRPTLGIHYDPEAFGQFSEAIARYLGTARFLVIQTGLVAVWIAINVGVAILRWDPYPFILLNLAFSTQAAYAAPLILLAQNRQESRDRAQIERDRDVASRTQADTEYLARELAAVRLALGDVASQADIAELTRTVELLNDRLHRLLDPGDDAARAS
jgi:uncharacterized membrane protein